MNRDGIVRDLPDEQYHRGPELSSTGAKAILDCPARYAWQQTHGRADTAAFDFGHAAHRFILGAGSTIDRFHGDSWRTNAAKLAQSTARKQGVTLLLASDYLRALNVAKAVKRHPIAGPLFTNGDAEVSFFWDDNGVRCRGRADYVRKLADGRDVIIDLKTTSGSAQPAAFGRTAYSYGYHLQAAWYLAGAVATGLVEPDAAYLIVAVEKEPPHPVTVFDLDHDALELGSVLAAKAVDTFRECSLTGEWPAYTTDIESLTLPAYAWKNTVGAPF